MNRVLHPESEGWRRISFLVPSCIALTLSFKAVSHRCCLIRAPFISCQCYSFTESEKSPLSDMKHTQFLSTPLSVLPIAGVRIHPQAYDSVAF